MPYNTYGYPAYAPQMAPQQQRPANDIQGVRWVSGFDEAKTTHVMPGSRIMMLDTNVDIFYIKDGMGNIEAYSFQKTDPPAPPEFVTRQELNEMRNSYEQLIQQYQQQLSSATNVNAQPVAADPAGTAIQWKSGASQEAVVRPDSSAELEQRSGQPVLG